MNFGKCEKWKVSQISVWDFDDLSPRLCFSFGNKNTRLGFGADSKCFEFDPSIPPLPRRDFLHFLHVTQLRWNNKNLHWFINHAPFGEIALEGSIYQTNQRRTFLYNPSGQSDHSALPCICLSGLNLILEQRWVASYMNYLHFFFLHFQ